MDYFTNKTTMDDKLIDFGFVPISTRIEKTLSIENISEKPLSYRVFSMYVHNNIDSVFKVSIDSHEINPGKYAVVKVIFHPNIPAHSFTEYFIIDDTGGNAYKLTIKGKCVGPKVWINEKQLVFTIRNRKDGEQRKKEIKLINKSLVDTTYQWFIPEQGISYFQISTGNCGVIKARETIITTVSFSGSSLGVYTAEFVCLVLNQEPLFLKIIATVLLPGNTFFTTNEPVFENYRRKFRYVQLMENSLDNLEYIPMASVFERYLDFGLGSASNVTMNISQILCVTNHEEIEGYIQWMSDPNQVFLVDPISASIPPNNSRLFTVRFRPKMPDEVYGYLLCGEYQQKTTEDDDTGSKVKHKWFRIPCIGNTWSPCEDCPSGWECLTEITMPPTVPGLPTFTNFMLSNTLETPMCFKFRAPEETNFVMVPMCGLIRGRGWQIISVALEPRTFGDYYETWELMINKLQKVRILVSGNAETSQIKLMSHGYNPSTHAVYEFAPTITGCTSNIASHLHNLTRMDIHIRVLNHCAWLGADNSGTIVLPPGEIVPYRWWFFPKTANKVYETTVTCSCVCLKDNRPVGDPTELFIQIIGFSERPDLKAGPNSLNLHDIVVDDLMKFSFTLYNFSSCCYTSQLFYLIDGMGDDYSGDQFEIGSKINSLKPSSHCEIDCTVKPGGAGPRRIRIKYNVLFTDEDDEIVAITPINKTICTVWYDGIYPTMKVKRAISAKCPVIFSNHCVWNLMNIDGLNKALVDCRPNEPLTVDLYAPDLCVRTSLVEIILVLGCVYAAPVVFSMVRDKICDCQMVEVQIGISTYEKRHTCVHRPLVEIAPLNGVVTPVSPVLLYVNFQYAIEGWNTLSYELSMANNRTLFLHIHILAHKHSKAILTPVRRSVEMLNYLAVMDCGRVPINNLHPVIRMVWLYNPTNAPVTWRLLPGSSAENEPLKCLLRFAAVPPLGKLAIPFAFQPTEMIDYEAEFSCSYGYEPVKILVKGQGGLPNCIETRMDIPFYVEKVIRAANRTHVVYLSTEHITLPLMATHSLTRDILAVNNDTDHVMRFIWLPERLSNIVNIVMTPCWGVILPKTTQWITMTVYSLQEPATFTTAVACELLDLTARKQYRQNEMLRKTKTEKCKQEFILTEQGTFYKDINDSPPYVLDLKKPLPYHLAMSVSVSTKGQRDGYQRLCLKQKWEQAPPYDLLSADISDSYNQIQRNANTNSLGKEDLFRIIDCMLWDALQTKMFKYHLEYYSKEDIPSHSQLLKALETEKPHLSRRVTAGICDAIVNKAIFHNYGLNPKQEVSILEAE